ncbi:hypothetical protein HETIRDRAFT_315713 [Heterobasidion irregulare TC 32-1]|uniref:Uncharacterized protein n=1 Tax=Heterobasidion irregulare (strain TC 32-1) TaxID=747525 RepID=W4KAP2_HETIT|nr:uncharacterized protein HETIRDRAFT_315713 [Heterobasidion irregulare TC 32-1]ETW82789.1 hypothetical protein HETIRDRAFT_315713 [Heterobasidion irregulare TC 32-1]
MSHFVEHDGRYSSPSFVHPVDATDGGLRRSDARRMSTRQSRSGSWQPQPTSMLAGGTYQPHPPPVEAISGIPTPAANARGLTEEDYDAEYMTVDPPPVTYPDEGYIYSNDTDDGQKPKQKRRFVGGFVSSLRRLPKAMARNVLYDRRPSLHRSAPHADIPIVLEPEGAPPYETPGEPITGNVHYVQATEMPIEYPAPAQPSHVRTPSHLSVQSARPPSHNTLHSHSHHSIYLPSHHSSDHHNSRSPPRVVRNPDPDEESEASTTEEGAPRPDREATPRPGTMHSPVLVEPKPGPDYVGMPPPIEPPPVPSRLATVRRFLHELSALPWMASTIAVDYIPAETARARYPRPEGGPVSWYTPRRRLNVDLLAGGPSTQAFAGGSGPGQPPAPAPIHASSATLAYPGASAPGHGSAEGAYQQPPSSSLGHGGQFVYSAVPVLSPPPPLYMYPAPLQAMSSQPRISPETHSETPLAGASPETQHQAFPIYVLAMPVPPYMRPPDPAHSSPHLYNPMYPAVHP